jgi:signal transduction histidine kinase
MRLTHLIPILLFIALVHRTGFGGELHNLYNSVNSDTAYLPYKSYEARNVIKAEDCSYPENNLIEVIYPAISDLKEGLLVLSDNPSLNKAGYSMFTPRTFPGFEVTDDDPIDYVITDWTTFRSDIDSNDYIVGLCHNQDSVFAFRLSLDTDSIEYKCLYGRAASDDRLIVSNACVLYSGDLDQSGTIEILLYAEHRPYFRKIFCLEFDDLDIRWERRVSSGINRSSFFVYEHPDSSRILFTTGNSANGLKDSVYNDYFSYFSILDCNGDVLFNKRLGLYGHRGPVFIQSDVDDEFLIAHFLDFVNSDSTNSGPGNEYYLSRVDLSGEVLKTVTIKSTPIDLWKMRAGDASEFRLFTLFGSKAISVYSLDLNLIDQIGPLEIFLNYYGRFKIAGEEDSVYAFSDGIYDNELNKLLQFPFNCGGFHPIEYDSSGNMTAYVIVEHLHYYIGYIKKKTSLELLSVFYHRNQPYVIIVVTGLLVALIVTATYQRKAEKNLQTISHQKRELENTHENLRQAQATIVAHERFQQARNIAGGFAHEIRNSLFPAKSALSKISQVNTLNQSESEYLTRISTIIDSSVSRAIKLTESISKYAKLESGRKEEKVDILQIVNSVVSTTNFMLDEQLIDINIVSSGDTQIIGSTDQFYIVVSNIILNAIDAVEGVDKPSIEVSVSSAGNEVEISIRDNGCGIAESDKHKIFDFFFSTKPSSGVGIGLSMVKKILELYDCRIKVESTSGQGTSFTIHCPKYDDQRSL